jgi:thiol-disulfide isomerase/thioredoxin
MPKKKTIEKNVIFNLILVFLILLGTGVGIYVLSQHNTSNVNTPDKTATDAIRFNREYPQVGENNVFVYRDIEQIISILKGGTGVVFLGFPECPWCQAYAPILNSVAMDIGIEKIYYFNIREDRASNTESYQTIVGLLQDHLDLDNEGRPRIFVPDVTIIKQGTIIGHDNETSLITDASLTPETYWTKEKVSALKDRLRAAMSQIVQSACTDVCQE